tara:strand:- start:7457 stop:10420 length:2964 start_codon:yes stop_codon:yes gene_type:complete
MKVLQHSPKLNQKLLAAQQLGKIGIGAAPAIPLLIKCLNLPLYWRYQSTLPLKKSAVWALSQMGIYGQIALPSLFVLLEDSQFKKGVIVAIQRLISASPTRALPLMNKILQRRKNGAACILIARLAAGMGATAQPLSHALVSLLSLPNMGSIGRAYTPTYKIKRAAIFALGALKSMKPTIVAGLSAMLEQPLTQDLARQALDRLFIQPATLPTKAHIHYLVLLLSDRRRRKGRIYAAQQLSYLGPLAYAAVPSLRKALQEKVTHTPGASLHEAALLALKSIGKRAYPAYKEVLTLLNHSSHRTLARTTLQTILPPEKKHIPLFVKLCRSTSTFVQMYALKQLHAIGPVALKAARQDLRSLLMYQKKRPTKLRQSALRGLARIGEQARFAAPTLHALISQPKKTHSSPALRVQAISLLAQLTSPLPKGSLRTFFVGLSDMQSVSTHAKRALDKHIDHPLTYFPLLKKMLGNQHNLRTRLYAAKQLARIPLELHTSAIMDAQRIAQIVSWIGEKRSAPSYIWAHAYARLAQHYLAHNAPKDRALKALSSAIKLGYDDIISLATAPAWAPLRKHKTFKILYRSIRISPRDLAELWWQRKEQRFIHHDTKMMIIENITRKDNSWTQVPQSTIPSHRTSSPTVKLGRILLRRQQQHQKSIVLRSDIQRKHHLTSMQIISNMGGSKQYWSRQRFATLARMRSLRIARQNAQRRIRRIQQRRFASSKRLSSSPKPPPGLHTLHPTKTQPQKQSRQTYVRHVKRLMRHRRWKQALPLLTTLIRWNPKQHDVYMSLYTAYVQTHQHKKALQAISHYLQLRPNDTDALYKRSLLYFSFRQWTQSKRDLQAILKQRPKDVNVYNNLAAVAIHQKHYKQAITRLKRALSLQPYAAYPSLNIAYLLLQSGQRKQAKQWLNRSSYALSNEPFFYYVRACLKAQEDHRGSALEDLRKALQKGFSYGKMLSEEVSLRILRRTLALRVLVAPYAKQLTHKRTSR